MDSGCDPYVLLLQYRNAQLSDFNKSPAELLFNCPLKTKLPVMPNALLSTESDRDTRLRLQQRQQCQKFYYDRGTRDLSHLQSGDVVRVNHNKQWLRGVIDTKHIEPRSYNVRTETGSVLRRNRRDIIASRETAPCCNPPTDDDYIPSASTQPLDNQLIPQQPHPVQFSDYVT